jgi:hypothetical protein
MWSTELIQIYNRHLEKGYESIFKLSPYYNNEMGLRRANLAFELTNAEQESIKNNTHPLHIYGGTLNQHHHLNRNNYIVNKYCVIDRKMYAAFLLDFVCRYVDRKMVVAGDISFFQVFLETYRLIPMFMKPGIVICNKEMMKFDNGNEIYFRPYSDKILSGVNPHVLLMLFFDTNRYHSHLEKVVYPTMFESSNSKIILHSETEINPKLYDMKKFTNLIY